MNRIELGEYLRAQRKKMKLTLKQMAEKIDITLPWLSDLEVGGMQRPSYDRLKKVSAGYNNVDLQLLLDVYYEEEKVEPEVEKAIKEILGNPRINAETREKVSAEKMGKYTKRLIAEIYDDLSKAKGKKKP